MLSKNKILDDLNFFYILFSFFEREKNFMKVLLEKNSFTPIFLVKLTRWRAYKPLT
ncbi:hypothetical protein LEP1GSC070_2350 [Leptospira santarosai str. AIM]|nr:hypothetical protein LEP1GSC070_2350 [Leptospira santarosai str. AIM]